MIRVTVWNEYIHEVELPEIRKIYPNGIHGCIEEFLSKEDDFQVRSITLSMPEHGLTKDVLDATDVLIWWGHAYHDQVEDYIVDRVKEYVLRGMGLLALHSAHYSKIMRNILGTTMTLRWKTQDYEKLICMEPSHPIAEGVPSKIILEKEELYAEPFDIPKPDDVVFMGWYQSGEVFRSGCTYTRGRGKIFYFQPGHEEYPIYYNLDIQQIIKNSIRWLRPINQSGIVPDNIHID